MGLFLLLLPFFFGRLRLQWLRWCGGSRRFSITVWCIITGRSRVGDTWSAFTMVTGTRFGMRCPRRISRIDCWWWRRWWRWFWWWRSLGGFNKPSMRREFKVGNIIFVEFSAGTDSTRWTGRRWWHFELKPKCNLLCKNNHYLFTWATLRS